MPISFQNIPANWRIPLYYVEVDPSMAGLPILIQPSLLFGIKLTAGTAPTNVPVPIASVAQADAAFGIGSQLSRMFRAYLPNNWANLVYGVGLTEGSVAAHGTITVATPPTAAGTYHLYIGGDHTPVDVNQGDTVTTVAASIAAAINGDPTSPVTATAAVGVVTVTVKWKGTSGNDITLADNYFGTPGGELMPPGLTVTYVQMLTTGTGDPDPTAAISALSENDYEYVCYPFLDSSGLNKIKAEFDFSDTGRWGWIRQKFGHIFSCMRGTVGTLQTFSATQNAAQLSVLGIEVNALSPVYEFAAAYTARAARALSIDPARPLQTLQFLNIIPAKLESRFLISELNTLSLSGLATQRTYADNIPTIARETTTWTKNSYGYSDDAYELVTTLATLARLIRNQRQAVTSKWPRHKLADDGTRFGAGQAIVTPKSIKAELVAQYAIDEFNGLVENRQAFINNLIVERDSNDPNRVNVLYPPDLINQLRVFAVLAQFRLQYNRGEQAIIT
jgi:phage tail sheath gpL-like